MNAASPQLSLVNGHPVVTSLNLAEVFGKEHRNIIRAINLLEVPKEFRLLNFEQSSYRNDQGKDQPMYRITRDGFTLLVMGFTGAKAMQFKLAYIDAFNKMEAELKARQEQPALGLEELAKAMQGIVDIQLHQSRLLERLFDYVRPSREKRERVSRDEEDMIARLYSLGWNKCKIGREIGRKQETVATVLRRLHVNATERTVQMKIPGWVDRFEMHLKQGGAK